MLSESEQNQLAKIQTELEKLRILVQELVDGIPTTKRLAKSMDKYISNSGNETYRLYCEDGAQVWLRQSHKDMLVECGLWSELEKLPLDDNIEFLIHFETIPDGDFHKPVKILAWTIV